MRILPTKIDIPNREAPALPSLEKPSGPQSNGLNQLAKAAQDFESLFLDMVLKSMRETVQKSGFMDGGNSEEIYRSLLDSEYAKIMAANNGTGLSESIVKQFAKKVGQSVDPKQVIANYNATTSRTTKPIEE